MTRAAWLRLSVAFAACPYCGAYRSQGCRRVRVWAGGEFNKVPRDMWGQFAAARPHVGRIRRGLVMGMPPLEEYQRPRGEQLDMWAA